MNFSGRHAISADVAIMAKFDHELTNWSVGYNRRSKRKVAKRVDGLSQNLYGPGRCRRAFDDQEPVQSAQVALGRRQDNDVVAQTFFAK